MIRKQLYAVWPLGLALFISACGGNAPASAVITAVEANRTTTFIQSTGLATTIDGVIHFKVQNSTTNPAPLGGISVELSGSSPTVGDPDSGFVSGGAFVDPADRNHVVTTTNANGVVSASYQFTVPKCNITDDVKVTASISASIGVSTATWIDNITIAKDPSC